MAAAAGPARGVLQRRGCHARSAAGTSRFPGCSSALLHLNMPSDMGVHVVNPCRSNVLLHIIQLHIKTELNVKPLQTILHKKM